MPGCLRGETAGAIDVDGSVKSQWIRRLLAHDVSASGAVDDDLDPLQRASPIGVGTDLTDGAHRTRPPSAHDSDGDMTASCKVDQHPLPYETRGARDGDHRHP
jgi:hypothetical protein